MNTLFHQFRRGAMLAAMLLVLAAVPSAVLISDTRPAQASSGISQRLGVDSCALNTLARTYAFWSGTPYYNFGLYIGGSFAGCPKNDPAFVSGLRSCTSVGCQNWQIMPIWVGPQAPCSSYSVRMSSNPSTAYEQGKNEAYLAYLRLQSLGMSVDNTPVIYDLENFPTSNTACVNTVKSFMQGWVFQLQIPPAQKAGVYGSVCSSALARYGENPNPPDFIHGAWWNNNPSTWNMTCIPSNYWVNNQRHKQYRGPHSETWNGVTLSTDSDCSNAPVWPGPDQWSLGQGCV